jgi:hypothetical protein
LLTVSTVEALRQKYTRSVFEIEFMEDARQFAESLKQVPWLADPEITVENGIPVLRVRAVDFEHARKELPGFVAGSGLTLVRYELGLPSLEDIFVEILASGGAQ